VQLTVRASTEAQADARAERFRQILSKATIEEIRETFHGNHILEIPNIWAVRAP
jgi:ribosomal protein S12 methylthiotransferase accessory factor YcaO